MHILGLLDFILNLAGLLLWLNWRAIRFDPFARPVPSTFSGTIRRAEPTRLRRWHFLAALAALLLVRSVLYWQVGPALRWVPTVDLVFVAPAFGGNYFAVLLFSAISFLQALVVFYFWLLFLAVVNRRSVEGDPFQKMIQLQLGRLARLAWPGQLILPLLGVAALWMLAHPLLVRVGVMNPTRTMAVLGEQGLLIGAGLVLSLKYLLPLFLLVHSVATYVYLGNHPVWEFVSRTARKILTPLNRLPLRLGKMDFAPLVGTALVLLILHFLPEWIRSQMIRRGLSVWPQ